MILRPAAPLDLALLRHWDSRPHIIAAVGEDGFLDWAVELDRRPAWRELLIAEVDGRPIGVVQIIDPAQEESHYWGDVAPNFRAIDVLIGEETALGRGHGTAIMRLVLERCFSQPDVAAVIVDPLVGNTRSHRFYERLGFTRIDRRMFGQDDCLVYRLDRAAWQKSLAG